MRIDRIEQQHQRRQRQQLRPRPRSDESENAMRRRRRRNRDRPPARPVQPTAAAEWGRMLALLAGQDPEQDPAEDQAAAAAAADPKQPALSASVAGNSAPAAVLRLSLSLRRVAVSRLQQIVALCTGRGTVADLPVRVVERQVKYSVMRRSAGYHYEADTSRCELVLVGTCKADWLICLRVCLFLCLSVCLCVCCQYVCLSGSRLCVLVYLAVCVPALASLACAPAPACLACV
jgi:hypothetical protein